MELNFLASAQRVAPVAFIFQSPYDISRFTKLINQKSYSYPCEIWERLNLFLF